MFQGYCRGDSKRPMVPIMPRIGHCRMPAFPALAEFLLHMADRTEWGMPYEYSPFPFSWGEISGLVCSFSSRFPFPFPVGGFPGDRFRQEG